MNAPAIFDDLTTLSDATRSRMLLVLERQELTVSELCAVLQLPQSTVSRHLKTLVGRQLGQRRGGTAPAATTPSRWTSATRHTRRLWSLLREQIAATPGADQDARRLKGVLGRRQSKSEEFFASAAGQWDRLRRELFGGASALHALPALVDSHLDSRRPWLRHRRDERRAGAVCRADDCGRSQRRHAPGRAASAAGRRQRRGPARRTRSAADRGCASSTQPS